MNVRSLTNHLEDYLRGEISAKKKVLACIDAQERSLASNDIASFEEAVLQAGGFCSRDEQSTLKRTRVLEGLAAHWNVPVVTLTLGGIARRLGEDGSRVSELRQELRKVIAEMVKRMRRLSALIGMHRRINTDIMQLILGCDSKEEVESGGSLVNAEA
jgi:hypothetical protein